MASFKRRAWKAYFSGNYLLAGDLYKAAGDYGKASKMYLKAHDFKSASEAEEALGRISDAVSLLMKAGDSVLAAKMWARHKQYNKAAKLLASTGNKVKAAEMALKGGNPALAVGYYEQAGRYMEAGRIAFKIDNEGKALLLFEKTLKQRPSVDSLNAPQQLEDREKVTEIANYFEEAGAYERAAEVYQELNKFEEAGQCWEAAKRFTKAAHLYRLANASNRLSTLEERTEYTPIELRADKLIKDGEVEEAARLLVGAGLKAKAAGLFESAGNMAAAAELRRELGDFEIAGNLFFRVQAYLPAADCFREAQLYKMAKECFLKAGHQKMASRMAFEAGNWEEAIDLAPDEEEKEALLGELQALSSHPGDKTRIEILKARLFLDINKPKVALSCLENAPPTSDEERLWSLYLAGRAREDLGEPDKAKDLYGRVLALDVKFQDVRSRLERAERSIGGQTTAKVRYALSDALYSDALGSWFRTKDAVSGVSILFYRPRTTKEIRQDVAEPEHLSNLKSLKHPNVLALLDRVRDGTTHSLIYEDFPGKPLSEWLGEGYKPSLYGAMNKLQQVLGGLAEAHAHGLFHNHLSPASVWLDDEGHVKISGIGLIANPSLPVASGVVSTLLRYLPGHFKDDSQPPCAYDLYGAGAIFLELLSGTPPPTNIKEEAIDKIAANLEVPKDTQRVLSRLLSSNPGRRYAGITDALSELSAQKFPPGAIIAGRYRILDELGRGGMGQVFRVRDRELDEVVALKTLRQRAGLTEEAKTRFLREIKISRKITHPNVVRVFDFGSWQDLLFLTMEFIPGMTLSQWAKEGHNRRATLRKKIDILRGIAAGLGEAHKLGIIHRDLKPQNVILTPSGIPKLLDFGIALVKVEESPDLTQEGHFVGSPKYVSPEQIQGLPLGPASDIYSFGLLSYFILTGRDAFAGEKSTLILIKQLKELPPAPSTFARMPPILDKLIMRCLNKEPEKRPAALSEVSGILKEII